MHDVTVSPPASVGSLDGGRPTRLPLVVYILAIGTFLMLTTEFVVAGILPDVANDIGISVPRSGLLITVFAVGMVAAPVIAMLTRRMPHRLTLVLALGVFAVGHILVALSSDFAVLLAARFLTALATGAFWAVAAVVATRVAPAGTSSRAVGVVTAGGMLATVLGVPLGALIAQAVGWRGTFWALAVFAMTVMPLIARHVPDQQPVHDDADEEARGPQAGSLRSELTALRSGRLWLALSACATTTGGVLAAYSFIAPLLTGRTGIPPSLVPLVLAGFGVGSLAGSLICGRLGDSRPHATTVVAAAVTVLVLVASVVASASPLPTAVVVVLLGLFGLGANPVLISLAVRYADHAPTLGSSLAVAAFNVGTAVASWVGALALESGLGPVGPVAVGAVISTLTLIPVVAPALAHRRGGSLRLVDDKASRCYAVCVSS